MGNDLERVMQINTFQHRHSAGLSIICQFLDWLGQRSICQKKGSASLEPVVIYITMVFNANKKTHPDSTGGLGNHTTKP